MNREDFLIETNFTDVINRVTLISTGSTTHAQPSESKFFELKFKKVNEKQLLVSIPKNPNYLVNGTYMVFLLDNNDVPSVGKIIYLK